MVNINLLHTGNWKEDFKKNRTIYLLVCSFGLLISYYMKDRFLFFINIFAFIWIIIVQIELETDILKKLGFK